MDEIALYEIYQALKRAEARMRGLPLVCKDCGREMNVDDEYARCWVCKRVYLLKPERNKWQ